MATITFRLPEADRDQLEAIARGRGISLSDLFRSLGDQLLGRDVADHPGDAPATLTMYERRTLGLLHRILVMEHGGVVDEDAEYHENQIRIIERGYTANYSDEFGSLYPELPRRDAALVWDILDMFRVLKDSAAQHKVTNRSLEFRGFDGNDSRESRLLDYAKWTIDAGRWRDMAEYFDAKHDHGNSHFPALPTYLRMLDVFEPIWQLKTRRAGFDLYLSEDELDQVAAAWPHPDNQ